MKLGRCQPHVARDAVRQLGMEHYAMVNTLMNLLLASDLGHLHDRDRARPYIDEVRAVLAFARGLQPPEHMIQRFNEIVEEANRWADGRPPAPASHWSERPAHETRDR